VVDGKIYVFGGDEGRNWIDDTEVYDPATDSWTARAPIPPEGIGAGLFTCSVVDDVVYLIGGVTGEMNMVWAYDPADDSWEEKRPLTFERVSPASAVVDGKILVFGGCRTVTDNPCTDPLEVVEEYDPRTDRWTVKAPMPTARFGLSAVALDGKVYAIGGGGTDESTVLEVYDPASDSWEVLPDMHWGHIKFASVVLDDQIYVFGREGVYTFTPE
jgi:N-acetylneuraminic acid mutarotase